MEQRHEEIIQSLCKIINDSEIKQQEIIDIVSGFLYHLGYSLEGNNYNSSEELLKEFASNPTTGNALMMQGLWIKEHWKRKEIKPNE